MESKEKILTESDKVNIVSDTKSDATPVKASVTDVKLDTAVVTVPQKLTPIQWDSVVTDFSTHYEKIKRLGGGATGEVYSVRDLITREFLAMKIISKEEKNFAEREANLLRKLNSSKIIKIYNYFTTKDNCYLILEKMESDLAKILRGQSKKLDPEHQKFFLEQMLKGVQYLHKNSIAHRDLKPSNFLVNGDCTTKICDFGHAVEMKEKEKEIETEIQTRWYRAPEVIMQSETFTSAIDMWSVGCIFAEILSHRTFLDKSVVDILFPGSDEEHQLRMIIERFGKPTEKTWPGVSKLPVYEWMEKLPDCLPKPWFTFFENEVGPQALDLLSKFLTYDPEKRITAAEALNHAYLKPY